MAALRIGMTFDPRTNQFRLGHKLSQDLPSKSPVYCRAGKVVSHSQNTNTLRAVTNLAY